MGRETDTVQLLAPLLLTGGKGADLVIRGNVVLNNLVLARILGPARPMDTLHPLRPKDRTAISAVLGLFNVPNTPHHHQTIRDPGSTVNMRVTNSGQEAGRP
jgi:hypothetical protein